MNSLKIRTIILLSIALFLVIFTSFYLYSFVEEGTHSSQVTFYYGITDDCRNVSCEIDLSSSNDQQCVNETFREESLRIYNQTCKPPRRTTICETKTTNDFCDKPNSCHDISIAHYTLITFCYVIVLSAIFFAIQGAKNDYLGKERTAFKMFTLFSFFFCVLMSGVFFYHIQLSNVNALGIDFVDCFEFYEYIYPKTAMFYYAITGVSLFYFGCVILFILCWVFYVLCMCQSEQ